MLISLYLSLKCFRDGCHCHSSDWLVCCRTEKELLTHDDLALLCDLFYLPFEHGGQGLQLLHEFNWLKSNAHLVTHANCTKNNVATEHEAPNKPEVRSIILICAHHRESSGKLFLSPVYNCCLSGLKSHKSPTCLFLGKGKRVCGWNVHVRLSRQ